MRLTAFFDQLEEWIFGEKTIQGIAWVCFIGGIIGWPLTSLTVFKSEPQGILGLSWGAIIFTAFQILQQEYTQKILRRNGN